MNDCYRIEAVFPFERFDNILALEAVVSLFDRFYAGGKFLCESKKIEIHTHLRNAKKKYKILRGEIEAHDVTISAGNVRNNHVSFIILNEKSPCRFIDPFAWVDALRATGEFIYAYYVNKEYDYWQNAESLIQYDSRGRDHSGLTLISNGMPYPLEEMVIDVSKNPGRRVIRSGYVEAVGEKMWLSPRFWDLIGGKDEARLRGAGWEVTEADGGITRLEVGPEVFREGADVERQAALRAALYGHP